MGDVFFSYFSAPRCRTCVCLALLMLAPATVETLRSFHPLALAFTAFTAMLISSFWFYKGFKIAFEMLDSRDAELSTRLKEFVFHHNRKDERPSLVALGGGTGLSSLLKGLKEVDVKLTAVVTVPFCRLHRSDAFRL